MPCLLHRLVILSQTWWLKALIKNIWQVQSGCFLESQLISFAPYDVFLWKQRKKNKTKQKETILTDNTRINDEKRTSLSMHQITCGSSCASWTFQDTNYPWSWTWKMWWKILKWVRRHGDLLFLLELSYHTVHGTSRLRVILNTRQRYFVHCPRYLALGFSSFKPLSSSYIKLLSQNHPKAVDIAVLSHRQWHPQLWISISGISPGSCECCMSIHAVAVFPIRSQKSSAWGSNQGVYRAWCRSVLSSAGTTHAGVWFPWLSQLHSLVAFPSRSCCSDEEDRDQATHSPWTHQLVLSQSCQSRTDRAWPDWYDKLCWLNQLP